jgi:hypothetical protein
VACSRVNLLFCGVSGLRCGVLEVLAVLGCYGALAGS